MSEMRKTGRASLRIAMIAAVLAISFSIPGGNATAGHTGAEAEQAAREVLDARDRANAAAQAMFDAESRLEVLTGDLAKAEQQLAELEVRVSDLRAGLAAGAVRQFIGAGQTGFALFNDIASTNDAATVNVLFGAATNSELVRADEYDEAISQLDHARDDLEARRAETSAARDSFGALTEAANAEVIELQRIEDERLEDAAVVHELERQRAERAEAERVKAEQAERVRQEAERERQRQAAKVPPPTTSPHPSAGSSGTPSTPKPTDTPVSPPTASPNPPATAGPGMACPVAGPRAFADTWGAPRSGGRRHEGVDMIAPGGTPLVAVESGSATFKTNALGGNAAWITSASGTRYYYAHLSAWEGSSRSVSKGEVIGYVGSTGNTTVNHLHFEVHPGGGAAVNPYPYVRNAC